VFLLLTCLIVDSDPIFTQALQTALAHTDDLRITGTAANCADMVRLCQQTQPNVILLDLHLLAPDPAQTITQLHAVSPHSKIILLGNGTNKKQVLQSLRLQTWGYLSKTNNTMDDIIAALHTLRNGGAILDPEIAGWILDKIQGT
jgi:DNA-binding NarL/FixJ family response regulator